MTLFPPMAVICDVCGEVCTVCHSCLEVEANKRSQMVDWVCVGCGARFKHIPHDDSVGYCTPCATVQAQAGLIDQLRANIRLLHDATIVGRNALQSTDLTARKYAYDAMNRLVDQVKPV